MDKGKNRRHGKVVSGGHSTRVEGLNKFIRILERWPEITSIRLGPIQHMSSTGGHKSKSPKTSNSNKTNLPGARARKRARAEGKLSFKATRPAMIGSRMTGINCHASDGAFVQLVVLCGDDLDALKLRLQNEGYGADW